MPLAYLILCVLIPSHNCHCFQPNSNSLQFRSSRPGRPPKRGPVGLSLPPTHLTQHPQLKKHRLDNGDYAYENSHISGEYLPVKEWGKSKKYVERDREKKVLQFVPHLVAVAVVVVPSQFGSLLSVGAAISTIDCNKIIWDRARYKLAGVQLVSLSYNVESCK